MGCEKINNPSEILHSAIPFVGKDYDKTRLIVYASAENLSSYKNEKKGNLDDDNKAIFRRYSNLNKGEYFPDLHCAPVGNGQLLIVSAYILKKLNYKITYDNAYEFISYIAADNLGKFSKVGNSNSDYIGNWNFLKYSKKYIEADLQILQPKMIILPYKAYEINEINELINSYVPSCICIPIYQMYPQNINLKDRISKYPKRRKNNIDPLIWEWHENISDKNIHKDNFRSVYNYLDYIIKKYIK